MSSLLLTASTVQSEPAATVTPPAYIQTDSHCPARRPITASLLEELLVPDRWEIADEESPADVWLVDPTGEESPELVFSGNRRQAEIWIEEWRREPLGFEAVVTAPGERPELEGGASWE